MWHPPQDDAWQGYGVELVAKQDGLAALAGFLALLGATLAGLLALLGAPFAAGLANLLLRRLCCRSITAIRGPSTAPRRICYLAGQGGES